MDIKKEMKSTRHQTIGGIRYRICDLGVDDLERAALNRKRIKENYAIDYWIRLEAQEQEEIKEFGWLPQVRRR